MNSGILLIFILALWIMAVLLFRNLKMDFFKFFVGSIGFFVITMIFFRAPLEKLLIDGLDNVLYIIGEKTGFFEVIKNYSILTFQAKSGGTISMSINYQCSGIIELLVYSSLVIFFPFVVKSRRIWMLIGGNLYLFVANIIRILFIVVVTVNLGVESFQLVHMVLARMLFFVLTIALYYKVFTKSQLKNQKVGEIK